MKRVLNCYCGIGGNRKLWKDVEVTGVELNPEIAAIYQDYFPDDTVIVADAHQYLLEHYNDGWDFIWSSPPCQSHSRMRQRIEVARGKSKPLYPDMKLYEEIIFLKHHVNCAWVVENVVPYYEPLIEHQKSDRHAFWCNFIITDKNFGGRGIIGVRGYNTQKMQSKRLGIDISKYKLSPELTKRKDQILNNCVEPELGLHIFNMAFKYKQHTLELVD